MSNIIDAMIVGAEKAGTTSLLHYLGQHPEVAIPGKYVAGIDKHDSGLEFAEFLSDARAAPERLRAQIAAEFGQVPDNVRVCLAKNVGIMYRPEAMVRLRTHNPAVKTIVILRSPIARAYSSFHYQQFRGEEELTDFDEALRRESEADPQDLSMHTRYVFKSSYAEHLANLDRIFGEDNVFVLTLEKFRSDPAGEYRRLCCFLEIDPGFEPDFSEKSNTARQARIRWLANAMYRDSAWKRLFRRVVPEQARKRLYMYIRSLNSRKSMRKFPRASAREALARRFEPELPMLSERLGYDLRDYWLEDFGDDRQHLR